MKRNIRNKLFILFILAALSSNGSLYAQESPVFIPANSSVKLAEDKQNQTLETPYSSKDSSNTKKSNNNQSSEYTIEDKQYIESYETFGIKNDKPEIKEERHSFKIKAPKKNDKKKGDEPKVLAGRAVEVLVDSDKLEYIQDEDKFVATGNAKVVVSGQEAELTADKVIYYQSEEYITAEKNVKIIKDGRTVLGDFARVNLNEQSALIDNPNAIISNIKMNAKEAYLYPEYIELTDGSAVMEKSDIDLSLSTGVYKPEEIKDSMPGFGTVIPTDPNKKSHFKIVAKEIDLDRAKKTNNLIVHKARVYIGKYKIATIPKVTLTIGENAKVVEAMLPEVGFNKNIGGIYFGPSLTLDLPLDASFRISPVFSAAGREHVIGGGAIGRFRSPSNTTDVAYTSTGNRLVLKGEQRFYKDTTKVEYIINEYPDKGFMGTGLYRPLYLVEFVDERKIAKVLNHNISTRLSAGIARDVHYGIATPRFQFQSNIISDKPIINIKDHIHLRLQAQTNVATYGTGDTYTVVRGGPRVDWNLGRLGLTTSYFHAGIWGKTPFTFDQFIRGTSNLLLAGDFKVCKYLSVGNISSLNLAKDGPEPRLSTENQFYVRVGPEDVKFRLGYDIQRKRSMFGIDLFLGSGRSSLGFDKMKILHPGIDLDQ